MSWPYDQVLPSDRPNNPATRLAIVWIKLIFNMSVTPVREQRTIGKWQTSLRPTRRSAQSVVPLVSAIPYRDRDPRPFYPFPSWVWSVLNPTLRNTP